jgi:pyruvate dehydrogenase E1 component beta subunit
MPKKSFRAALNEALHHEMERDPTVILLGEDVTGGHGASGEKDAWGGAFGVSKGLLGRFGPERVRDTPITESAFVGAAGGAAMTGLRPVVEIMFVDFLGVCFDQIFNQIAKARYMFGGRARSPIVIRTTFGAGVGSASQHSQALYPLFTHIPGLKVVVPSSPYDAKGLLIEAIRDDDPVVFLENKLLYDRTGEVPDAAYTVPFGEANVVREGDDLVIVALGRMVEVAEEAARTLKAEGVSATVLDPRTTSPLDTGTIIEFVEATGRVVVVDESNPRCGMAADIAALIAEEAFDALKAPVLRVTPPHTPVPYAPELERAYVPDAARVAAAGRRVIGHGG